MCDGSQCSLCLPIHCFSLSTLNQQYYLRWNVWIFGYKNCVNLFTGETVNVYTWQTMCITDFAMYEKIKPMTEECLRLLQRTCEKRAPCLLKIEHMPRWFGTADGTPSDCCLHDVKFLSIFKSQETITASEWSMLVNSLQVLLYFRLHYQAVY